MQLSDTLNIASAGMRSQDARLRIVAENIANADSVPTNKGGNPYRRKLITFKNTLDDQLGFDTVKVASRTFDQAPFTMKYMPYHPAANEQGYVSTPNVNPIVEMMDMREARRAYEANLSVVETARGMMMRTIDLLK